MNNAQRTYFVKRAKDINKDRKQKIKQYFAEEFSKIKDAGTLLNDWYANASAREIREASHELLATMMKWFNSKPTYLCVFRLPTEYEAAEGDCVLPVMADVVLEHKKKVDVLSSKMNLCLAAEDKYLQELIDSVMFDKDEAKLAKLLQKYQEKSLPVI